MCFILKVNEQIKSKASILIKAHSSKHGFMNILSDLLNEWFIGAWYYS